MKNSKRIALLYLVSDILHNSTAAVPNASRYRSSFEKNIPMIFDALNSAIQKITGRMTAQSLKEKVRHDADR